MFSKYLNLEITPETSKYDASDLCTAVGGDQLFD